MKRQAWKWLLLGGALTFLVLFGLEMSTTGIEEIYGPMDGQTAAYGEAEAAGRQEANEPARYESETERRIAELEKELAEIRKLAYGGEADVRDNPRLPGVPYEEDRPAVNKLADSTAGLLQSASSKGIRFVVSLFDGFME